MPISGKASTLLIGKNGSGKSTLGKALQLFQSMARGTNRVGELLKIEDFSQGRIDAPIRFEIEVNNKMVQVWNKDMNNFYFH